MQQNLSVVSCKLPTGDGVYCGVTLESYAQLKRGDQLVMLDDVPEEGSAGTNSQFHLRMRWYRCTVPRGGAVCSVHPEKEATMQCTVCLKHRVPQHLSYHCSMECLRSHWHLHKDYHKQSTLRSIGGENGYDGIRSDQSSGESWVEVGRGRSYTPTGDDVGYELKFEIAVIDRFHPQQVLDRTRQGAAYTARVRPTPNPPARQMVQMIPASSQHPGGRFTLLSYNLLADLYAKADLANYCKPWSLHWHYRKRNLLREMLTYKADILCLQEVQSDHYLEFWAPELQKAGYVAIYKKKTHEICTGPKTTAIDGCATFFRKDRFSLVKKYEVEFNKAAMSLAEQFSNPADKSQALNRLLKDNVALIAVLEAIDSGPADTGGKRTLLCVANTHIHANPDLNDVKLWQVHTLLKGLEKIAASADIPMLVAGDFNSIPGSPAHTLLVTGKVDEAAVSMIDPLNYLNNAKPMTHTLPLASAYAALHDAHWAVDSRLQKQKQRTDSTHHEPLFSILSRDFKGTLDYILYTKSYLQPTAVLELPLEADVLMNSTEPQLPNAQYSSDHIAIMSEFQYLRS